MGRPLAACGTITAYQRHKRRKEPVDALCAQAARDQKNKRMAAKRSEAAEKYVANQEAEPVPESVDELADARENLRLVRAAMKNCHPRDLAPLSKRRQELVERIRQLDKPEEASVFDELARARKERLANAAG